MKSIQLVTGMALMIACLSVQALNVSAQQSGSEEPAAMAQGKAELEAMQAIEDTWSRALLKRDQFALEGVLAPDYVDISENGEVSTRNQQIARLFVKDTEAISFEQKVASVRVFGDIAVVNGTYVLRYTSAGRTVDDKGIFSHVFEKTRSRWECINAERTFVVEQTGVSRRPSVLPFHVPGTRPPGNAATPNPSK